MIEYVAGLLFSEDRSHVALIEKKKPEWQKNRLNAIGGKIEENESPLEAMQREFTEETGVKNVRWQETAVLGGNDWKVYFFHAFGNPFACEYQEGESEFPVVLEVQDAVRSAYLIPNLKTLIPLALDESGISKPVFLYDYS